MRLLNLPLPIFAAVLAPQVEPPGAATIGEMLVLAAALSLPVGGILWALIEWRGRRVFATQTDLNGLGKRVDECESRGDRMEQMTDSTRERVGLIEAALASDRRHQADLGCGNGRLLESFRKRVSGLVVSGVEVLAERAERARARLPGADIKIGEMCGCGSWPKASHVLLMPGRLLEHDSHRLRSWLVGRVLVVYAYGDWLQRHGGLSGLCDAAGLVLTKAIAESGGVAVGLAALSEVAAAAPATPPPLETS